MAFKTVVHLREAGPLGSSVRSISFLGFETLSENPLDATVVQGVKVRLLLALGREFIVAKNGKTSMVSGRAGRGPPGRGDWGMSSCFDARLGALKLLQYWTIGFRQWSAALGLWVRLQNTKKARMRNRQPTIRPVSEK